MSFYLSCIHYIECYKLDRKSITLRLIFIIFSDYIEDRVITENWVYLKLTICFSFFSLVFSPLSFFFFFFFFFFYELFSLFLWTSASLWRFYVLYRFAYENHSPTFLELTSKSCFSNLFGRLYSRFLVS